MKKLLVTLFMAATSLWGWSAGEYTQNFGGGTGTKDDPYQVSTMLHLSNMAVLAYWTTDFAGTYFVMTGDIAFGLTSDMMWGIGTSNRRFQGEFDGQGHKITGITLNGALNGGGLFSWIGANGVVKNLTIDGVTMNGAERANNTSIFADNVSGLVENCHVVNAAQNFNSTTQNNFNGGFAAYLTSTGVIRNCSFSGTVKTACGYGGITGRNYGGLVENCTSNAQISISHGSTYVGGVCGTAQWFNNGSDINFSNCTFKGTISATEHFNGNNVGGICGYGSPVVIADCVNKGNIMAVGYVGGIAGSLSGTTTRVSQCYNMGLIQDIFMAHDSTTVAFQMSDFVAGIAGYMCGGLLQRSFNGGTLRSYRSAGGLVGTTGATAGVLTIEDCYNSGLIDAPFVWRTSETTPYMQKVGGIVAELSGTYGLNISRCLSLGTINNAVAARNANCEYVGYTLSADNVTYTDCYYDNQVAGNTSEMGGKSTLEMTDGSSLENFDPQVWAFSADMYPRLKCSAQSEAAMLCASPYYLANQEFHGKVKSNFTVSDGAGVRWTVASGAPVVITGTEVSVSRGHEPVDVKLISMLDGNLHESLITVYPDAFEGDGTAQSPYQIQSYADMVLLSDATNAGGMAFEGEHFQLMNDIDMESGFEFFSKDASTPFMGTFDGNGHVLNNLYMRNDLTQTQNGGLFGYVGQSGVVKNLTIAGNSNIGLYLNGGTIAAYLQGTIENVKVLPYTIYSATGAGTFGGIVGRVESTGRVIDCYVGAQLALNGAAHHVGGIACYNYGLIDGCQFAGNVGGSAANYIGGIASETQGRIVDCLASGYVTAMSYAGAVASRDFASSSIENTLATGQVTYSANVEVVGAVVGSSNGTFDGVWYDKQMGVYDNISTDGLEGKLTREIISNWNGGSKWVTSGTVYPQLAKFAGEKIAQLYSYPIIMADGDNRSDMNGSATVFATTGLTSRLDDGDDFTLAGGKITPDASDTYCSDELIQSVTGVSDPVRRTLVGAYGRQMATGNGTKESPWVINSAADLMKLATQSNAVPTMAHYVGKHFKLGQDIELTGSFAGIDAALTGTTPVNMPRWFRGEIDGDGHSVSNLNIASTNSYGLVGLVGYLGPDGVVKNLTIASGTVSGTRFVGAAVGKCAGTVQNVANHANVTSTTGNASAGSGGVVGYATTTAQLDELTNYGTVTNSMASGACYTAGVVGYVAGNGTKTFTRLANYGEVSGPMIIAGVVSTSKAVAYDDVANYATVRGTAATSNLNGGCFGDLISTTLVNNARNYGAVNGSTGVGGVVGRYSTLAGQVHVPIELTHCLNAGDVTGKISYVGGIVGMSDTTRIHVKACVNVGHIANTATSVAAGTPAAGGIVGGGSPIIEDCYNAGIVAGVNCIGGLLGRPVSNSAKADIINSLNVGWLEGYAQNSANVGAVTGYNSTVAHYDNVLYDRQMCDVAAAGKTDVEGVSALLTSEIAVADVALTGDWVKQEKRYPVPAELAQDSAVAITAMPVFLNVDDTRCAVSRNFEIAQADGYSWTADSVFTIKAQHVTIKPNTHGEYAITVIAGTHSRTYPLMVDFAAQPGDVNADGRVDVADVNILINIILKMDDADNYDGRAYVNDDNVVDVADVNAIINIILKV